VPNPPSNPKFQLPLRIVLISLLAVAAGVVTSTLLWAAGAVVAKAVLSGLGVIGAAVLFFDKIIE
jgi:hypothetical protein